MIYRIALDKGTGLGFMTLDDGTLGYWTLGYGTLGYGTLSYRTHGYQVLKIFFCLNDTFTSLMDQTYHDGDNHHEAE